MAVVCFGTGQRKGPTRPGPCPHPDSGLLLRTEVAAAAGVERENQRAFTPKFFPKHPHFPPVPNPPLFTSQGTPWGFVQGGGATPPEAGFFQAGVGANPPAKAAGVKGFQTGLAPPRLGAPGGEGPAKPRNFFFVGRKKFFNWWQYWVCAPC